MSPLCPASPSRAASTHLGRSWLLRTTPRPAALAVVGLRAHPHSHLKGNGQPNPGVQRTRVAPLSEPLTPDVRQAYAPASRWGSPTACCPASASRSLLGSTISVRRRPSLRPIGRVKLQVPSPRPPGRSWFVAFRLSPPRPVPAQCLAFSDRRQSNRTRFIRPASGISSP